VTERPELADLHCHFVPDVDDGAATVEQALHYLREGVDEGVTRVVATPHLPASRASSPLRIRIEENFRELEEAAATELPELSLGLAFEIRLDGAEMDLADEGLWLGPGGHVLVEFDRFQVPADPLAPLAPVLEAGRIPVLAHPERYRGAGDAAEWVDGLREAGVRTCLNAGSLAGRYGHRAERLGKRLLARGQADLVASDHHARPDRAYSLGSAWELLAGWDEEEAGRRMLSENPLAVLEGRELAPAPRVSPPEPAESPGSAGPRETALGSWTFGASAREEGGGSG
jgi:protein-tyrosine phosphatase